MPTSLTSKLLKEKQVHKVVYFQIILQSTIAIHLVQVW